MNKLYCCLSGFLLSAYCLLPFSSVAQTFIFSGTDTIKHSAPGKLFSCTDSLMNTSSTGFYVDAVRLENNPPPGWETAFCLDVCYPPFLDSARVYLPANSSQIFVLDFSADSFGSDTAMVYMKFKNVMNPSNVIYKRFHGITVEGLGTQGPASLQDTEVRIYPSPVLSAHPFCINIIENQGKDIAFTLKVYDVYGNAVFLNGLKRGDNVVTLNLPAGMYLYHLIGDGGAGKSGTLAVSR